MSANKHTNKLKLQNYAYEVSDTGVFTRATSGSNVYFQPFDTSNKPITGHGEYSLIEAMDVDWRPYKINNTNLVTTYDLVRTIESGINTAIGNNTYIRTTYFSTLNNVAGLQMNITYGTASPASTYVTYNNVRPVIPVFSNTSYGVLKSAAAPTKTFSNLSAQTTNTASRYYGVVSTTDGFAYVNVPWQNDDLHVTAETYHYTPTATAADLTKNASGGQSATFGTTSVITGVTLKRDSKGHVVDMSVSSIKMPSNPNTDEKVAQKLIADNKDYRLLLKWTNNDTDETNNARFADSLFYNPSTNILTNNGPLYLTESRERFASFGSTLNHIPPMNITGFKSFGYPLYTDPEFSKESPTGNWAVSVYNNTSGGAVTITREISDEAPNSSGYVLKITTNGTASPYAGGFCQAAPSRANAIFVQLFRAKIPIGYSVEGYQNSMGTDYTTGWLTDVKGTGKWEWYARIIHCGATGTFSTGGHVALRGSDNTSVTWYLAYANIIDITKGNYDGLRTREADHATNADNATNATNATNADNADKLDGHDSTYFASLESLSSYLPLTGGTMTGAIRRYYGSASDDPMISLTSNNQNVWLWRISHGSSADVAISASTGFGLKYMGAQDGNNNNLVLYADNINGTQVKSIEINQNGKINTYTQIESKVANGTAPFIVASSTKVEHLNADLLDGYDYTYFAPATSLMNYVLKTGDTMTGPLTIASTTYGNYNEGIRLTRAANNWVGITFGSTGTSGAPSNGWFAALNPQNQFIIGTSSTASTGLCLNAGGDMLWRNSKVWTEGNDGPDSGLNADLLDDLHASDFALAQHTHNSLDIVPINSKTYGEDQSLYGINSSWDNTTWYFFSLKPNSATDYWHIKYKIKVIIPGDSAKRTTVSIIDYYGYGVSLTSYKVWNDILTGYASYYHAVYLLTTNGFTNGYGHAIGESIRSGTNYTTAAWYRTMQVYLLEYEGCTVEMFDTPKKWSEWEGSGYPAYDANHNLTGYGTTENYARGDTTPWTVNSTSQGLQETGDATEVQSIYLSYSRLTAGTYGIKMYSLIMEDGNGKWQSLTQSSGTGTTKLINDSGFRIGSHLYLYNKNVDVSPNTQIPYNSVVMVHAVLHDFRYTLNIASDNTLAHGAVGLTRYLPVYIVGEMHDDGLFYLDNTLDANNRRKCWTQTPSESDGNKIYIKVSEAVYVDNGSNPDGQYRGDFVGDGDAYWFKDGQFIKYEQHVDKSDHAKSSAELDTAPSLAPGTNTKKITVTAGGKTSSEYTVPFATEATNLTNKPVLAPGTSNTNAITVKAGEKTSAEFIVPFATNSGTVSGFSVLGHYNLLYKNANEVTFNTSDMTEDFWYVKITFKSSWASIVKEKIVLIADYSNHQTIAELQIFGGRSFGYSYKAHSYQSTDLIVGICTFDANNGKMGIWLKLKKPTTYENALPNGKLRVYSSYVDTITAYATADLPSGKTFDSTLNQDGQHIFSASLKANSFIKRGGTSSQFLKADGSVDSTAYATAASLGNYLPLAGGTMTGAAPINFTVNKVALNFRTGHESYSSKVEYMTSGNEALVFANKNAVTSFLFLNGVDLTDTNNYGSLASTAVLQMKNNKVSINKAIRGSTDSQTATLEVGGDVLATMFKTANYQISEYSSRLCFGSYGQTVAKGINIGDLLVSNAWADASNVPTNGIYSKGQIRSGVAQGTAPFVIASNERVANLNADLLDGYHASDITGMSLNRLRRANLNVSSTFSGMIPPDILGFKNGYPIYTDPEFASGNNSISVYNNKSGSSAVTITRMTDDQTSGNSSGKILKVHSSATNATPNGGGWYFGTSGIVGHTMVCIFRAKIPTGYNVIYTTNTIGTGGDKGWLTETAGTGKWEWYACLAEFGTSPSSSFFFCLDHTADVDWYLSYANVIDITRGNYDGLRTRYADAATSATQTVVKQNTSVGFNMPLVWSNENNAQDKTSDQLRKSYNNLYWNPYLKSFGAGENVIVEGTYSQSTGYNTEAHGNCSHAEGYQTITYGEDSHAEGSKTYAGGDYSHSEGYETIANMRSSHSEGEETIANGWYSHSEGHGTIADGGTSHAEGYESISSGLRSHAEGWSTQATGNDSHSEGTSTLAIGEYSHAEGHGSYRRLYILSVTNNVFSTREELNRNNVRIGSTIEYKGHYSQVSSMPSNKSFTLFGDIHIQPNNYVNVIKDGYALGGHSHVEGEGNIAVGTNSHAEGHNTKSQGPNSHSEGYGTTSSGDHSHAEGYGTTSSGNYSHSEGHNTQATNTNAHAEGYGTRAYGASSHAEGYNTYAQGMYSHAEGHGTGAQGHYSHAEGLNTLAFGNCSSVFGVNTIANNYGEVAFGRGNISNVDEDEDLWSTIFSVGGGSIEDENRFNLFEITKEGRIAIHKTMPSAVLDIDNIVDQTLAFDTAANGYRLPYTRKGTINLSSPSIGSGTGITNGYSTGISFGYANRAIAGIYSQTSASYGSKLIFTTTNNVSYQYPRMIIDHAGNVGINTLTPSYKLHVNGTGCFEDKVRINSAFPQLDLRSNGTEASIYFRPSSDSNTTWAAGRGVWSVGGFGIGIYGTGCKFTILDNGNTGIGINSPDYKLHVNGTFSSSNFGYIDSSGKNCNNVNYTGIQYYNSNGPTTSIGSSTNDGALYSQAYSSAWVGQIAQDYRNGQLFVRGKNNNIWQAWRRILDSVNSSVSLTGAGNTVGSALTVKINGTEKTLTIPASNETDHYTPSENSNYELSETADSTTDATFGTTAFITGVTIKRDSKGHVVDMEINSARLPGMGSGSGLDADTLDGQHASYFAPATSLLNYLKLEGGTMTGTIKRTYSASNQTPMLTMHAIDYDNYLWTISSSSASKYYGFGLLFHGEGTGNGNSLRLIADNQNGTDVIAVEIDQAGKIDVAKQVESKVATGTAPFKVASTTKVTNLNADLLDGLHADTTATVSTVAARDANGNLTAKHFNVEHANGGQYEYRLTYSTTVDMAMMIGTGNANHGLYDIKNSKWMIYSDLSGNVTVNGNATTATSATTATTADKLSTVSKTAWGQTFWTSGGIPATISGDMSSVGNIAFSASGKNIGGITYYDTTNSRFGVGRSTPETTVDVNGVIQAYEAGRDDSAFKNLVIIKQQNGTEASNQEWDAAKPSFGIGFKRYYTNSSNQAYGETEHAGIYSTVSNTWRGGLVFRTKNDTTQGGSHDTTALRLRPDGGAIFANKIDVANSSSANAQYSTAGICVREYNYGGTQSDSWTIAPRLAWWWSGRKAAQIGLASNGHLYISEDNFTSSYRIVMETGTWGISISGTAAKASTVKTVASTSNAKYYMTFVDSNNSSATDESVYTSDKFHVNPSTGRIGIGIAAPETALDVSGDIQASGDIRAKGNDLYVGAASGSQCHQQYDATTQCLKFVFD